MAKYPAEVVTLDQALVGYDDRYRSSVLGRKFSGWPRGVHVGFIPSNTPPSPILTFNVDPTEGYSLLKVPSSLDPSGLDIFTTDPVAIDFTGFPTFPCHVVARATYDDSGGPSSALIEARAVSSIAWNEVLLAEISGSPTALSISANPTLGTRTAPLALTGTNFGYMPGGSIEALETAADMVNEVVAARVALDAEIYPSLSERIEADYNGPSMGGRLGRGLRVLRSNDFTAAAGISSFNVSGSFSSVDRDHNPRITLNGNGSETADGAVAAPVDQVRNVAIIQDAVTGYRPVDATDTRRVIFGRIEGPTVKAVTGTLTFTNASTDVTAVDAQFTAEVQVGDTVLGPDGNFYEVAVVTDDTNLVLRDAYVSATGTISTSSLRRWLLKLRKITTAETSAVLASATTIRFFFPAFLNLSGAAFDYDLAGLTSGEPPPLPAATTTLEGRGQLAATGALVGAVNLQNAGVPVAGGPFHTINFQAGGSQVVQTAPGEVLVGEIGSPGAAGPPGIPSAPGPPGGPGAGYSQINPFERDVVVANPSPAPVTVSFVKDMGHNIRMLSGGVAEFRVGAAFGGDSWEITALEISDVTEGTIEATLTPDSSLALYLSSAGD